MTEQKAWKDMTGEERTATIGKLPFNPPDDYVFEGEETPADTVCTNCYGRGKHQRFDIRSRQTIVKSCAYCNGTGDTTKHTKRACTSCGKPLTRQSDYIDELCWHCSIEQNYGR